MISAPPTLLDAKEFFGILDATWAAMSEEEQQTYVDEIMDSPKLLWQYRAQSGIEE